VSRSERTHEFCRLRMAPDCHKLGPLAEPHRRCASPSLYTRVLTQPPCCTSASHTTDAFNLSPAMSDRVQAPFYAPFAVGGPNAQAVGMPPMVLPGTIPSETGPRNVLVVVTEQGLEIRMPGGQRRLLSAENGAVFPSSMGFSYLCHTANTRPVVRAYAPRRESSVTADTILVLVFVSPLSQHS